MSVSVSVRGHILHLTRSLAGGKSPEDCLHRVNKEAIPQNKFVNINKAVFSFGVSRESWPEAALLTDACISLAVFSCRSPVCFWSHNYMLAYLLDADFSTG